MKMTRFLIFCVLTGCVSSLSPCYAADTIFHNFTGTTTDGGNPGFPNGSLTLLGGSLYGMTFSGGSANAGTIFRMNTNGSNFVLLYSFPGGSGGQNPRCALTPSGSFLYGMTTLGGSGGPGVNDSGTIFRINSDGTAFTQLHIFDGSGIEGGRPFGSLTISGQFLYGITAYGGENNSGTLFRINIDGSGYTVLHNFAPAACPSGSLTLSGFILCGMTGGDGVYGRGTIFSIAVDGTGFTTIHDSLVGPMMDGDQRMVR